jgi:CrcB protein
MRLLFYAAAGGAIGTAARHLVNVGFGRWLAAGFPWSTLFVNVVGSFLMGALIEAFALKFKGSLELRTFLATGILGGFTTFSAFSMDFAHLAQRHEVAAAVTYVVASVVLSIAALYAGLWLVRWLVT